MMCRRRGEEFLPLPTSRGSVIPRQDCLCEMHCQKELKRLRGQRNVGAVVLFPECNPSVTESRAR